MSRDKSIFLILSCVVLLLAVSVFVFEPNSHLYSGSAEENWQSLTLINTTPDLQTTAINAASDLPVISRRTGELWHHLTIANADRELLLGSTVEFWEPLTLENVTSDKPIAMQMGMTLARSEKELMEGSALVVYGRVTGRSEAFIIENPIIGARSVFTDYYVKVYEVLRGETDSDEIIVRMEGGATDELVLINYDAPLLGQNGEYILFLSVPSYYAFDTPGNYYYVFGGKLGIIFRGAPVVTNEGVIIGHTRIEDSRFDSRSTTFYHQLHVVNSTVPIPTAEDAKLHSIKMIKWYASPAAGGSMRSMSDEELEEEINAIRNAPLYPARVVETKSSDAPPSTIYIVE